MKLVFTKTNEIDWNEIVHLLSEDKAIKVYFSTQEIFIVCNVNGMLLSQNGLNFEDSDNSVYDVNVHKVSAHQLRFNPEQLQYLIECYSFGGDLDNIVKIEVMDFKVRLI